MIWSRLRGENWDILGWITADRNRKEDQDMSIFSILTRSDMSDGVERFRQTPGAVLLDVRTPE